jgi:hypothetical protein
MGFIHNNTNGFEVYLTDYGLQTFYRYGLKDEAMFFSCMDDDANYLQLDGSNYDPTNIFNNTNNSLPTIDAPSGTTVNNTHRVFTTTNKRGGVIDGKLHTNPLLKINEDTFKNYIAFEGDLTTEQDYSLLSYRKINGVKQYHIRGINGLYLKYNDSGVTVDNIIQDVDSYPQTETDYDFSYVNARYNKIVTNNSVIKWFSGSNDYKKLNKSTPISSITRTSYLILNELYDIEFDFVFSFYTPDTGATGTTININAYAMLGKKKHDVLWYNPTGNTSNLQLAYLDDTAVPTSVAEISSDHKQLQVKQLITQTITGTTYSREVYVKGRIARGMCKKSKDLTIVVDYNGQFGGKSKITIVTEDPDPIDPDPIDGGGWTGSGGTGGSTGGGGGCLIEGTTIIMANGTTKKVEDLRKGDELLSTDIMTLDKHRDDPEYLKTWKAYSLFQTPGTTRVKANIKRTIDGMFMFNRKFRTSPSHIHFVYNGKYYEFKTADKIKVGEYLIKKDGTREQIWDLQIIPGEFTMYQVDTEALDVFIADDYITHNKLAPVEEVQ